MKWPSRGNLLVNTQVVMKIQICLGAEFMCQGNQDREGVSLCHPLSLPCCDDGSLMFDCGVYKEILPYIGFCSTLSFVFVTL